jgi:hypothetical protein
MGIGFFLSKYHAAWVLRDLPRWNAEGNLPTINILRQKSHRLQGEDRTEGTTKKSAAAVEICRFGRFTGLSGHPAVRAR